MPSSTASPERPSGPRSSAAGRARRSQGPALPRRAGQPARQPGPRRRLSGADGAGSASAGSRQAARGLIVRGGRCGCLEDGVARRQGRVSRPPLRCLGSPPHGHRRAGLRCSAVAPAAPFLGVAERPAAGAEFLSGAAPPSDMSGPRLRAAFSPAVRWAASRIPRRPATQPWRGPGRLRAPQSEPVSTRCTALVPGSAASARASRAILTVTPITWRRSRRDRRLALRAASASMICR